MSQKWRRSIAWQREHFPPALRPLGWVLHAFSTITLAVILLSAVVLYATLASVPIGLLALAPTYLLYGFTLLLTLLLIAGLPTFVTARLMRGSDRGVMFAACFGLLLTLGVLAAWGWAAFVWPALRYEQATGRGVRLFAEFVEQHKSTTMRRLPALEMSELEFYSWWPLRVILLAFVANMVVATVRRIEFVFVNLGVLTVHTGIVVLTLGSVYYSGLKKEGDTILFAGGLTEDGTPLAGEPQNAFYDNTETALSVAVGERWEYLPLRGGARVPRYNAYNLRAIGGDTAMDSVGRFDPGPDGGRTLNKALPLNLSGPGEAPVSVRIVGYSPYARPTPDWVKVDLSQFTAVRPGTRLNPVRFVEMLSSVPPDAAAGDTRPAPGPERRAARFFFLPAMPAHRVSQGMDVFEIEYTRGMDDARWRDLSAEVPTGTLHALVVEVPGTTPAFRTVVPVEPGTVVTAGDTGYTVAVRDLLREPPFPIITEGYRGASSSVAVVRITTPTGEGYDRYVYHRFPEISQDLLDERNEAGMPRRRDADPAIRVGFIDVTRLFTSIDEREDGSLRVAVRRPGGAVAVQERVEPDAAFEMVPFLRLRVTDRWDHAVAVDRPTTVPEHDQDRQFMGTHDEAMLGVEVAVGDGSGDPSRPDWSGDQSHPDRSGDQSHPDRSGDQSHPDRSGNWSHRFRSVVWLPFMKYRETADPQNPPTRHLDLPDGRRLTLQWGRLAHRLPGFTLELLDFTMKSYDHRGAPRDYQSRLRVTLEQGGSYEHVAKLNAPLTAPFLWSPERGLISNIAGRLAAGLNPHQFKFSQAGWDAQMWQETQREADAGRAPRPYVRYTILGVGNNPGIHLIALGGVLVAVGIPWAFYVKPLILRQRKRKVQRQLAQGTYQRPRVVVEAAAGA